MGMMSEFKEFAMKGNVMDLAVGVIIGGAFGKIVDSLVGDVIMPVIAALFGGKLDFSSLLIPLGEVPAGTAMTLDALKKAGVPVFAYGSFITIVINAVKTQKENGCRTQLSQELAFTGIQPLIDGR